MKNITFIFAFFLLVSAVGAQDITLAYVAERNKEALASQGYEFLESKVSLTNNHYMLGLDTENFLSGHTYAVVLLVEGCPTCKVMLNMFEPKSKKEYEFPVEMKVSGNFSAGTYEFKQANDGRGKVNAFVSSDFEYYTYILLFKKPL